MAEVITRTANFSMDVSSDNISFGTKLQSTTNWRTLALQLILGNLVAGTDGTFQLIVSNDGVNWTPVPTRGGISYTAVVSGAGTTSFFIFVDEPIAGAEYVGLKYTRVGGTGTLRQVIISGTAM